MKTIDFFLPLTVAAAIFAACSVQIPRYEAKEDKPKIPDEQTPEEDGDELIRNGNFEEVTDSVLPIAWQGPNVASFVPFVTLDEDVSHSETHSLKVKSYGVPPADWIGFSQQLSETAGGAEVIVSFWAKMSRPADILLPAVMFATVTDTTWSVEKQVQRIGTCDAQSWCHYQAGPFTLTADREIDMRLHFLAINENNGGQNGDMIWFDDFSVKKVIAKK